MTRKVSIIMPAWNAEAFIDEAIKSVLAQTYADFDLIIVNDGSIDATLKIATDFADVDKRIHIISGAHAGVSSARNIGLENATGEFISFLDSDDLWTEDRLSEHMDVFIKAPFDDLVFGLVRIFEDDRLGPISVPTISEPILAPNLGAGTIRRQVFDDVGRFDETLPASEDIDMLMRCHEIGKQFNIIQSNSLLHRRHARNMSNNFVFNGKMLVQVYARASVRRRRPGYPIPSTPFPLAMPSQANKKQ